MESSRGILTDPLPAARVPTSFQSKGKLMRSTFRALAALICAAAGSCSGTPKGPDANGPVPAGMLEHDVRSGEKILGGHVALEEIRRGRTGPGTMLYVLDLRNEGRDPIAFRVFPRWYDSVDQLTKGGLDRWHRYDLKPGERQSLEMRAPTAEIVRAAIVVEALHERIP